jgi:hypothetical protein
MCYIRMVDRITGEDVELQFPTVGTTFRGSRLQRLMTPGSPECLDYLDYVTDYGPSKNKNKPKLPDIKEY